MSEPQDMKRRHFLRLFTATAGALPVQGFLVDRARAAETYPDRPVRIIVPFTPGGNTDISGRIIAEALSKGTGKTFFVENRGGAGGMIGGKVVSESTPDGYTLLLGASGPTTISPLIYKNPPYDPVVSFAPIGLIAISAIAAVVRTGLPIRSIQELISFAGAKPGSLTVANAGTGTSGHLANELFQHMAGVRFVQVPYNGGGPAILAVVAGEVDVLFDQVTSTMPFAQQGSVRALAVTTADRVPAYPDLPTIAESGLPAYQAETYTGLFAPAATPPEVIGWLAEKTAAAAQDPAVAKAFAAVGAEAKWLPPKAFAKYLDSERQRWREVKDAAAITLN